jgi:flagellar protein FliS
MLLGTASYNKVAVQTADQKTLILLCYDEAIRSLQSGKECFLKKEYEEKFNWFTRAQDFVSELAAGLNMEAGGKIAQNLRAIYDFVIKGITRADLKMDFRLLDQLIAILSELRSAWAEMDNRQVAVGLTGQVYAPPPPVVRGIAV